MIKRSRNNFYNFFVNLSITNWLVLINVVSFILVLLFFPSSETELNPFIRDNLAISVDNILNLRIWTVLTSVFMHANAAHLLVNIISLVFIGNFVERIIGRKRLLWFYLVAGIVAGLFFVSLSLLFNTNLYVPAVGASGAIFGLGGLLMVLTPNWPVLVFFVIPMKMRTAMIFLLAILWMASFGLGLPIGNLAHLGGMLAGIAYGINLKKKYPKKIALLNRYFQ